MQEVVRPKAITSAMPMPPDAGAEKALRYTRRLIWTYLVLLIFEGALRKWIVPRFSDPLLVVRDPVVIAIYICALRARVFPRNIFMTSLGIIAGLSWLISIVVLLPYLPHKTILLVTAYGFRSNFLHLPLIFVIANVFNADDVKRMGWWILAGLIPMALLMAAQFRASPDSFINRTAGLGEGEQITAGGGKIRPPGTFSFISGVIFYMSSAAAFLIHGIISRTHLQKLAAYRLRIRARCCGRNFRQQIGRRIGCARRPVAARYFGASTRSGESIWSQPAPRCHCRMDHQLRADFQRRAGNSLGPLYRISRSFAKLHRWWFALAHLQRFRQRFSCV